MQTSFRLVKKNFLVDDSFSYLKYRYLLVIKLKANLYYKKLLCYLVFYISFQILLS